MNIRPTISVTIATRNEQDNIRECLESVKWADEIVIVDDLSTDNTVVICQEYKAVIYRNDSCGSFHVNKNIAITRATSEWILSLDADEVVSPALQSELQTVLRENDGGIMGYYMCRKNYFLGKWIRGCGWFPNYVLRLFKKGSTQWPLEIHDVPRIDPPEKTAKLKHHLYHFSYKDLDHYFDKFNRYTSRLAQEQREKGVRIQWYNWPLFFIIKPLYWFLRKYIVLRGFRDGFHGFFISVSSGLTVFTMYAKLWEITRNDQGSRGKV